MKFKLGKDDGKPVDGLQTTEQIVPEETPNIVADGKAEPAPIILSEMREAVADRAGEIQQRRTRDSRHFKNADGSSSAVFYSEPLFFMNSEGAYEEIDNTLEKYEENGEMRYRNKRNRFHVSFAAKTESAELLSISQEDYRVSLSLTDAESRNAAPDIVQALRGSKRINRAVVPALHRNRHKGFSDREMDILYENYTDGADLQYIAGADRVKENIIIKEKRDNYEYAYVLRVVNLDIRLAEDKRSIELFSNKGDSERVIFNIPAPFMHDKDGTYSDSVVFEAEEMGSDAVGKSYLFKIIADQEWVNAEERAFPVVIDPQIVSVGSSFIEIQNWYETTGSSYPATYQHNGSQYLLGRNGSYNYFVKVIVKTPNIQSKAFENATRVLNASFKLFQASGSVSGSQGFMVKLGAKVVDHFEYNAANNNKCVPVNITNELNEAIKGNTSTTTFEIRRVATSANSDYIYFYKAGHATMPPQLVIDYIPEDFAEDNSETITFDAKRAGSGNVNLFKRNVMFAHHDVSAESAALPINISHIYDSKIKDYEYQFKKYGNSIDQLTQDYRMGKGWKLNIQQNLINKDRKRLDGTEHSLLGADSHISYVDGDGKKHLFEKKYYYEKEGVKYFVKLEECNKDSSTQEFVRVDDINYQITVQGLEYTIYEEYMDDNRANLYVDSDKAKILDLMNEPYQERLYYILDGERRYVECDGNDYFNYLIGKISDSSVYNQYEIDLRYTYKEGNKRYFSYGNTKREVTVYTVQKKLYRDGNYFYIYNLYPVYYSSNTAFHWSTQQVKAYLFKERQYGNDSNKIVVSESSIPEDLLAIDQEIAEIDDYLFQLTETKEDYKRQTSVNELKETYNALSVDIISISQSIETSALNKEKELLDRQIALTNDAISAEEKGILEQYKYDLQYYQGQVNKFESQAAKAKDGSKKEGRKEAKVEKNQAEYDRILKEQNNEIAKATASYILNNDNAYFQIEMNREKRELAMKQNELNIIKMAIDAQLNTDAQNQLQKDILDVQDTIDKTDEIRKYKEGIRAKLITIEKQKPMDYIVAENDWALGFDYYGRMVAVIDNYENSTIVMYKDDNIDYVITSDELVMQFLYNGDGRLSKIIDHKYRETQYEYDTDGRLIRIIYPDNTAEKGGNGEYPLGASVSNFKYYTDNNSLKNNLKEIVDQSGYAVQLAYPTNQVTVQDGTYATGIDKFEITPNEVNGAAQFNAGKLTTVKFQNNWSARVEGDAGATTYVFDNIGRVMSKYEDGTYLDNNYISVTNAIASAYNGKQRSYSVSVDENKENYILNPSFDNAASWQYSAGISITSGAYAYGSTALRLSADPMAQRFIFQPISQAASPVKFAAIGNKKNLVLSLWAKADSAYIVSDRRTGYEDTMLVSHTDGYDISKRKFEIKATAAYASGAPDIFTVSFDWLNTEWQLATLPIRLDKERNLSSIEVRFDYSYNVNDVYIDNFRLSEGEGEYCEYYPDGKLKFVTDGTTESHYKYNGIANPSETVQIDADGNKATTKYTYNYQGSLIRSEDWSGIVAEYEYDDKGHEIKSVTYHKDDPTSKFYSEDRLDEKGRVSESVDPRGVAAANHKYFAGTSLVKSVTDAFGATVEYGYNHNNDQKVSVSLSDGGEEHTNKYKYTAGHLTEMSNNSDTKIGYKLDGFGRTEETLLNGRVYVKHEYADETVAGKKGGKATSMLATGEIFVEIADHKGRSKESWYAPDGNADAVMYAESQYDASGRLEWFKDKTSGTAVRHDYTYPTEYKTVHTAPYMTTEHNYDNKKRLSGYKHTIGATERNYGYEYESGFIGRLKKVTLPNNFTQNYEYDAMGRANGAALKRADGSALLREYGYYVKAGDHATNMLSSARYGVNGAVTEQLKYGYDARGNIASVTENGRLKARYFYDGLNRLIREDNADFNRTYAFTYDNGGNILTKTENNLSFGDSFTPVKVIPYVYDPDWKDLLLSYDGEECQYDGNDAVKFGNPTKYRDIGCTYSYGGRLMSMAQGGDTLNFTYDASGTRKSKGTTQYIYENGQLIRQSTGGDALDFYYDAGGVMGFKRGDDDYFFRKNPQGDVTHIYSIAGKLQAYYAYDAWGNCKVTCYDVNENAIAETDPAFETHIGNINPIRYRSYYFDTETGLYYLMSRYYDPETGRFINADNAEVAIALQGDMLNGLNLYSYSMNNPVNFSDPSGHSITLGIILLLTLGLAAAGATVGGVQAAANGGNVWDGIWKGALIGGMVGLSVSLMGAGIFGFAGFGTAGALGFGGMFAANAGIAASMAFSAGMTSFMALNSTVNANQGNFSTMNMGQAFKSWGSGVIIGGMTGALTFGIGTVLKPLGSSIEYGLGLIGKGGLTIGKFIGPAAWAGLMSAGRLLGAGASILMSREFMTYTGLNPNGKSVLQYILA